MFRLCAAVLVACLVSSTALCAQEAAVRDIGSRRELFVDRWLIDSLKDARLKLHHPVPREIVLRFDKPWEGQFSAYVTVIKDGDLYRMYYRGWPALDGSGRRVACTCCAESRDGVHWTRPTLGLYEVCGTRDNNVILANAGAVNHNFCPFLDTRPGVPKEERYKAVGGSRKSGLIAFVSADGIHWKKLRAEPILTQGAFDSQNLAFWSKAEGCYCAYFRIFYKRKRGISRCTSKDFLTWSEPQRMTYGDTPLEHLYTNQTQPYVRAPHLYIATPARIVFGRTVPTPEQLDDLGVHKSQRNACSDGVLLTSRGGTAYDRTFLESFIRPGPGVKHWTARSNYPALGIVPTGPAELSIYVRRCYAQPTAHMQRLTLRTDGFASVNAGYGGGEMITKPLTFQGKQLDVNVATSAVGSLRVELQDAGGAPIEGYTLADCRPLIGDFVDRTVAWKQGADVSPLAGKPLRIRIVLKDADLYAIRFH
ncbi:MAG: hypothetical protein ACODAJ_02790 [Planctomycetota bacterium]